jgi:hypothetical protein
VEDPIWSAWPMISTVMFGSAFMIAVIRSSSLACAPTTFALPASNRADVSSTTRTPIARGTVGSIVSRLSTGTGVLALAIANAWR